MGHRVRGVAGKAVRRAAGRLALLVLALVPLLVFCAPASAAVWTATLTPAGAPTPAPAGDPMAIQQAQIAFDNTAGTLTAVVTIAGPPPVPDSTALDSLTVIVGSASECQAASSQYSLGLTGTDPGSITVHYYFGGTPPDAMIWSTSGFDTPAPQASVSGNTVTITVSDPLLAAGDPLSCATASSRYDTPSSPFVASTTEYQQLSIFSLSDSSAAGPPPTVGVSVPSDGSELDFKFSQPNCGSGGGGPITLTIADTSAHSATLSTGCSGGYWIPDTVTTDTGTLSGDTGTSASWTPDTTAGVTDGTFSYSVGFGGKTIAAGKFRVSGGGFHTQQIWEGTDEFINYCIGQARRSTRRAAASTAGIHTPATTRSGSSTRPAPQARRACPRSRVPRPRTTRASRWAAGRARCTTSS